MRPPSLPHIASASLLRSAFERVRANGGAPGSDGVSIEMFASELDRHVSELGSALRKGAYHPFPLLLVAIPKRSGGDRLLAIPSIRDRVAQGAVYLATWRRFEREFEDCSYGYRRRRSVRGAIERVRRLRDAGFRWVVDADIEACFDRIPHDLLLARLQTLQLGSDLEALFRLWIEAEVYDGTSLRRLSAGVPQGSAVSPMLSNLYLDHLDEELLRYQMAVVRYADDFVVLCRDEGTALDALELTEEILQRLRLSLHPAKTRVRSFREGIRFLGATFLERGVYIAVDPPCDERMVRTARRHPAPLTLRRYLELKRLADPCPRSM